MKKPCSTNKTGMSTSPVKDREKIDQTQTAAEQRHRPRHVSTVHNHTAFLFKALTEITQLDICVKDQ